jgi:hypothetical protein
MSAASAGSGSDAGAASSFDGRAADARGDLADATEAVPDAEASEASDAHGEDATIGPVPVKGPPFTVAANLFDPTRPNDQGLAAAPGTETVTIFQPTATSDHYSNGVVLVAFQGWLYAQWQSSATDEDSPDTWTAYSRSQDGKTWSAPRALAARASDGERTSGGWWVAGGTLVAYINVWPSALTPRGGFTQFVTSTDGTTWSAPKSLPMADGTPMAGVFEQDPHLLAGGRVLNAAHFQPGLVAAPCYTDDPSGTAGWMRAPFSNLSTTAASSREVEPSSYVRADGVTVMVFRDQSGTYRKLAAMSGDRGSTWTVPVVTNMPDSRAKQSAGNLPDGTAFFVSNPVPNATRIPLAVTLSRDGQLFDRAFLLRGGGDLQPQRYPGVAKTPGYDYPKSMAYGGSLYVGYSVNKEDVQLTRVPLASLAY